MSNVLQPHVELISDCQCGTGESPVWVAAEQALYWVDIPSARLYRWHAASGQVQHWQTPEMIGCIAVNATRSGFIAGMETGVFAFDNPALSANALPHHPLTTQRLASVVHAQDGMRFNDGRCDRQGRFWAGTMVINNPTAQASGALYRYTADQGLTVFLQGLLTPNGLAFSPDGRRMYLSDSHPQSQCIWVFDYDIDTGTPSHQRLWVDMKSLPGRPDGAAVDADGCYWICGNDAGLVHRFTPDGRLDRSIRVPILKPAMCAFGGADLSTLFVTSIRPSGMDLSDQPLAGGVFAFQPGVQGLPEPAFQPSTDQVQ